MYMMRCMQENKRNRRCMGRRFLDFMKKIAALLALLLFCGMFAAVFAKEEVFSLEIGVSPLAIKGYSEGTDRALLDILGRFSAQLQHDGKHSKILLRFDDAPLFTVADDGKHQELLEMNKLLPFPISQPIDLKNAENVFFELFSALWEADNYLDEKVKFHTNGSLKVEGAQKAAKRKTFGLHRDNFPKYLEKLLGAVEAIKVPHIVKEEMLKQLRGLKYAKKMELSRYEDKEGKPFSYYLSGTIKHFDADNTLRLRITKISDEQYTLYIKGSQKEESYDIRMDFSKKEDALDLSGYIKRNVKVKKVKRKDTIDFSFSAAQKGIRGEFVHVYPLDERQEASAKITLDLKNKGDVLEGKAELDVEKKLLYKLGTRQHIAFPVRFMKNSSDIALSKQAHRLETVSQKELNEFFAQRMLSVLQYVPKADRRGFLHDISSEFRYYSEEIPALK